MGNANVCCPILWDSRRNPIPIDKPGYSCYIKKGSLYFAIAIQKLYSLKVSYILYFIWEFASA